jgi:hypothetical protein
VKKRVVALLLALMFSATGMIANDCKVYAEESEQDVDMSEIWTEDALVGYVEAQTWGVYLAEGVSIINNAGGGKIGCGGITSAAVRCKVSVNAVVEKKVNGSWTRVTSWTNTSASAYSVSISKYLSVGSGYYYRVRSTHHASTDASSSCTEGLWM